MVQHAKHRPPLEEDIPPVLDADAEDVAWALGTARALWRRHERPDALAWLRRAARAAADADDDARAVHLARAAADLADVETARPTSAVQSIVPPAAGLFSEEEVPTRPSSARVVPVVTALSPPPADLFDPWREADEVVTSAPPLPPRPPLEGAEDVDAWSDGLRAVAAARTTMPDVEVDLAAVPELVELPEGARATLTARAQVLLLVEGEQVSDAALVLVVSGAVEARRAGRDEMPGYMLAGSILRARASGLVVRCAGDRAVVALWDEASVDGVLADCPWVEEELARAFRGLFGAA